MAKIYSLKISKYRGIKHFDQIFGKTNFICLIGRGDSGKTTLLHAIEAVLSSKWNYTFNETDFHNGDIETPIEIETSLYDVPTELLTDTKYGLFKRLLKTDGAIIDDLSQEDDENNVDILTIKLVVKKDLEPKWFVTNNRDNQEDIEIRSSDRAKLNVFLVSDYIDRHFCWSKGNPLYSLMKLENIEDDCGEILTDAYRDAKNSIDIKSFSSFDGILEKIKRTAVDIGLPIEEATTSIDFKDTFIKEGNISIHDNKIPFRLNGKGTKRLLSIAIQLELAKQGGIILIDEIEQGLEPDRAKFLSKKLKEKNTGQTFITTHSSNILVELSAEDIFIMNKINESLFKLNNEFQGTIRKNPEAFFGKRIIVCEGATEVGICRALNDYLISQGFDNLSLKGIVIADGTGDNLIKYSVHLKRAGFEVCVLCDSDVIEFNKKKQTLIDREILVIDCGQNNSIEQQVFNDLPWEQIEKLIDYAIQDRSLQSILDVLGKKSASEVKSSDTPEIRQLLGSKAKEKEWFKRIDHGEFIGKIWFENINNIDGTKLKEEYDALINWINK